MRLFNDKDKKNIKSTFFISMILFLALFLSVEVFGSGSKKILGMIKNSSGDAANSLVDIAPKVNESLRDKFGVGKEKDLPERIRTVDVEVSCDELYITSSDDTFRAYFSEEKNNDRLLISYEDTILEISLEEHISDSLTVEIPKKILENNEVKIDIDANCNIIFLRNIRSSEDDSVTIDAERGIVSAVSAHFRKMDLSSEMDSVVVSDCSAEVLECESESAEVAIDGEFAEIRAEGKGNVMCSIESSLNRIDASSEDGIVNVIFYGDPLTGFTARLINSSGEFRDEYGSSLDPSSRQGSLIYRYGDGTTKINITDTNGPITIRKHGE